MPNWEALEKGFTARLHLKRPPVAVAFLDSPPAGVAPFQGSSPAGCVNEQPLRARFVSILNCCCWTSHSERSTQSRVAR